MLNASPCIKLIRPARLYLTELNGSIFHLTVFSGPLPSILVVVEPHDRAILCHAMSTEK